MGGRDTGVPAGAGHSWRLLRRYRTGALAVVIASAVLAVAVTALFLVGLPGPLLPGPTGAAMGMVLALVVGAAAAATARLWGGLGGRLLAQTERLSALADEHQLLMEHSGDMVFRTNLQGEYTFVSPGVERITGYSVAEWVTGWRGYLTDDDHNTLALARSRDALAEGRTQHPYQLNLWHKNGSTVVLEVNERPYREDGAVAGVIGVARDVTERKRAETALARTVVEWIYAMDFVEDAVCLLDPHQRVVRGNRAFYNLLGVEAGDAEGASLERVFRPAGGACRLFREERARLQDGHTVLEVEDPRNLMGRPMEATLRIMRGDGEEVQGMVLALSDLTRSRRIEEEQLLAASVFEGSLEGILIVDGQRRIVKANRAFTDMTGYGDEDLAQHQPGLLLARRNPAGLYREMWRTLRRTGSWQGELWLERREGGAFPTWWNVRALRGPAGRVQRYIAMCFDITEKKQSEERIHYLANFDAVTGLPNRVLFQDRLHHALERAGRARERVGLLFLDLDRFKDVNDTLGHSAGDSLLKQAANRIREEVRRQDTVCRLGGDEFTIILESMAEPQEAALVAEKVLGAVARPFRVEGHEVFATASIGISLYPADGRDVSTLLKNADTAMYRSKEHGRNRFQYYTREMTVSARERLATEVALRYALQREEFALHYQPQVDLHSGEVVGAEALIRWQRPGHGMVPPDHFIPVAEDSRLITAIGEWVLETACRQYQAWAAAGRAPGRVAVNLSAPQFADRRLVRQVLRVLDETGMSPRHLEVEITESTLMESRERVVRVLEELHEIGVQIAIDDFGTGYSSLGYLKRFPIQRLKVDRSFVRELPQDRDDGAITGAIIAMSRQLGIDVIAEGVESRAQVDYLRELGCQEVQGYYCSRPLEVADFETFLATRHFSLRPLLGLAV